MLPGCKRYQIIAPDELRSHTEVLGCRQSSVWPEDGPDAVAKLPIVHGEKVN